MKFQFSNVVVVDEVEIGVIVKSWDNDTHDVYVRSYNQIANYRENNIDHYIYSKELSGEQATFYVVEQ